MFPSGPTLLSMKSMLLALLIVSAPAFAYEPGSFFVDPTIAAGYNTAQGTNIMVGLDIGYAITELLTAGVGGQFSAGKRPEHDQAIGAGPFVAYFQPLTSFLGVGIREDVSYLDQRNPYVVTSASGEETWGHTKETGVASITSVGLHLRIGSNLGISGGYRAVMSLSNSSLDDDRSGTFLGISIGI